MTAKEISFGCIDARHVDEIIIWFVRSSASYLCPSWFMVHVSCRRMSVSVRGRRLSSFLLSHPRPGS